jgi:hypothetical protein
MVARHVTANHPENAGSTADRYQVVVHSADNTATHLENGPHLSAETSRRVACDCCKTKVKDEEYAVWVLSNTRSLE